MYFNGGSLCQCVNVSYSFQPFDKPRLGQSIAHCMMEMSEKSV